MLNTFIITCGEYVLLVVSLHSGSDVQKKKRRSLKDFRLILEGWVVGFEPTTFRTTSGSFANNNLLIIRCLYCGTF